MSAKRPIVIVTGGRGYADPDRLYDVLDEIRPGLVLDGGCRTGADAHARRWCDLRGVHGMRCDALWDFHGRKAGPIRNAVLVEVGKRLGASVVAFPGGNGTADCVARARAAGLPVREVDRAGGCSRVCGFCRHFGRVGYGLNRPYVCHGPAVAREFAADFLNRETGVLNCAAENCPGFARKDG